MWERLLLFQATGNKWHHRTVMSPGTRPNRARPLGFYGLYNRPRERKTCCGTLEGATA